MTFHYTFLIALCVSNCLYSHTSLEPAGQEKTVQKGKFDSYWISVLNGRNMYAIQKVLDSSDVNIRLIFDQTPLIHVISKLGDENLVKFLLKVPEIDVNPQDMFKMTALMHTACWNRVNIAKLLLEVPGIKLNPKNKDGETAYDCAKGRNHHALGKLIKNKIDELTEKAFEAIKDNNIENLKSVIEQLGDDIVDAGGHTLLDKAFLTNRPKIIEFLLTSTQDPQDLLSRFPFELANPTSHIFKYFFELAYGTHGWLITNDRSSAAGHVDHIEIDTANKPKQNSCAYCSSDFASTSHRLLGANKASPDLDSGLLEQLFTANSCAYCSQKNCLTRCSICKSVYYCSTDCQKADWKTHKHHCKTHT